jgi:putative OPT family oligopeptide transporter
LISTLAKGVLGAGLDWPLIGAGAALGAALIVVDALLRRGGHRPVPPLAVGLGIYLPMGATLPVVVGAILGHIYERRTRSEVAARTGVLLASGFIVGDGLFGVLLAGLIVATGKGAPLALVGDGFTTPSIFVGLAVFAAILAWLYRWIARVSAAL